jgi:putative endonuclease
MTEKTYCIYILTNVRNTVFYVGVTNDLQRRILDHRMGIGSQFAKKYRLNKLVYFECGDSIEKAIAREKQIKGGSRQRKIDLINSLNPDWNDLYDEYFA